MHRETDRLKISVILLHAIRKGGDRSTDDKEISNPDLTITYLSNMHNLSSSSGFEIEPQYL